MADHLLRDVDGEVVLAVVDHEAEADKVGHNGAGTRLGEDGGVVAEGLLQRGEGRDVGTCGGVSMVMYEGRRGRRAEGRM